MFIFRIWAAYEHEILPYHQTEFITKIVKNGLFVNSAPYTLSILIFASLARVRRVRYLSFVIRGRKLSAGIQFAPLQKTFTLLMQNRNDSPPFSGSCSNSTRRNPIFLFILICSFPSMLILNFTPYKICSANPLCHHKLWIFYFDWKSCLPAALLVSTVEL